MMSSLYGVNNGCSATSTSTGPSHIMNTNISVHLGVVAIVVVVVVARKLW